MIIYVGNHVYICIVYVLYEIRTHRFIRFDECASLWKNTIDISNHKASNLYMLQKKEHMLLCSIFQFSKPTTSERSLLPFIYIHILSVGMFITLLMRCRFLTLKLISCSISPGWLSSVFENSRKCAFPSFVWVSRKGLANERNRSRYQVFPHCLRRYFAMVHDDVIKWKKIPRYWPFVWGIHRSPVNPPHKGQWRGALMFFLSAPE